VLPYPTREFRSPASRIAFFQIFMLFLWGLAAQMGTVFFAALLNASEFSTFMLGGAVGGAVWLVRYQMLTERLGWETLKLRFSVTSAKPLLAGLAMAAAVMLTTVGASAALQLLGVKIFDPGEPFLTGELDHLPFLILVVVIIGPLAEELIFRGLLLDWLKQKLAPVAAAVITSLAFALAHNNHLLSGAVGWLQLFDRFLIGISASWLVLRYKSLAPAFVMHAANNCVGVVVNALQTGST
jgi:uncharacterized protein